MTRPSFDHAEPIGAPDAAIASALEAAHLPTLMAALVHLTGDTELEKAKNQTTAAFFMALDSIFYRAMLLGRTETVASLAATRHASAKITRPLWAQR